MYTHLDQSKHQIRLLRLLPGRGSDNVHCELFTVSLDEPNEFEALSYVWGSNKDLVQIVLSGQVKDVTKNLGSALHHLRNGEKERILWVDAVCINQNDNPERGSQVQLMQRIYSTASSVVVWLGPLQPKNEPILKFIRRLGSNPRLHWTAIQNMKDELMELYIFLSHEWWSRIWTVQEAVLANQIVYHRGNIHISSHDLNGAAASFKEHVFAKKCCQDLRLPKNGIRAADTIERLMDNILRLYHVSLGIRNANFDEVALLFRHRQATNALDMVYGLLGISRGIKKSSINYDFSKAEVYELATRDSISHNNNLHILSQISCGKAHRDIGSTVYSVDWPEDTPSWVLDLTDRDNEARHDIEAIRYRAPFLDHYNACGTLTYKSTKDDSVGKLHLAGVCCDTIEKISDESSEGLLITGIDTIKDWRNMAGMEKDPGKPYIGRETVSEAFWRTLCLDIYASGVPTMDQARFIRRADARERDAHLLYWYMQISKLKKIKVLKTRGIDTGPTGFVKGMHEFFDHLSKASLRRTFFISRKGYMGLGPLGMQVDDHICVLAGGRAPFIVRPVKQNDGQATSRFVCRLLGDAYVHGLMDGEALRLADDGILQVKDFELI
ncbi:HET-domain-containing protein [Xylaria cf. heliscus]|nr:HET-domain-containing protein [Xylaria cf. heliscus]